MIEGNTEAYSNTVTLNHIQGAQLTTSAGAGLGVHAIPSIETVSSPATSTWAATAALMAAPPVENSTAAARIRNLYLMTS